jgi:hypothetical protein
VSSSTLHNVVDDSKLRALATVVIGALFVGVLAYRSFDGRVPR